MAPLKELLLKKSTKRVSSSQSFSGLDIYIDEGADQPSSSVGNSTSRPFTSRWSDSDNQSIRRKPVPAYAPSSKLLLSPGGTTSWEGDLGEVVPDEAIVAPKEPSSPATINFHRRPSISPPPAQTSLPAFVNPVATASNLSPTRSTHSTSSTQFHRPTSSNRLPSALNSRTRVLYAGGGGSGTGPTRAPIESFGSFDMLQGQRDHVELQRGSEVFSQGFYEGRMINLSKSTSQTSIVKPRIAKVSKRVSVAPKLPPLDLHSVASTLRSTPADGSFEERHDYRRRFSSSGSSQEDDTPSPAAKTFTTTKNFSFPARSLASPLDAPPNFISSSEGDIGLGDGDEGLGPFFEKALYGDQQQRSPGSEKGESSYDEGRTSSEELVHRVSSGWRKEYLLSANTNSADQHIVSLPVYPAPDGSMDRSPSYRLKKAGVRLSIITSVFAQLAMLAYMSERVRALIIVEQKMPGVFLSGWAFLAVEITLAFLFAVHSLITAFSTKAINTAAKLRLRGDSNLPAVDVLVIASGQSDQVVFDCAVAAASMDFPVHRFRVLVIDPVGSSSLEKKLMLHARTQAAPHLTYHRKALDVTNKRDYLSKANLIQYGVSGARVKGSRGAGEFVVVFDADMIPERNYLRAVLPSFIGSVNVALALVPHGFINIPRRVNQATSTLLTASESHSNYRSGFMLRRSALSDIGGFPADSSIQDGECSALLHGKGYGIVKIDEVLQYTAARPTYHTQVRSMMVDGLGALRTAARLRFFLGGKKIEKMSSSLRIAALSRAFRPFLSVVVSILAMSYPYMFSYGGIMVLTPSHAELVFLLELTLGMVVLDRLHELVFTWSTGLPSPRRVFQSWIFIAPYQGLSFLLLALPFSLGGFSKRLDVSSETYLATPAPTRDPFWKRFVLLVLDPHFGVLISFAGSIGVCIWRALENFEHGTIDVHQTALTILLTVAWPSLIWIDFMFAALVPFVCLLFPSSLLTEPRDSFLIRDHYTSIARPKHSFKTSFPLEVQRFPEVLTGFFMVGWAAGAVVLALMTSVFR